MSSKWYNLLRVIAELNQSQIVNILNIYSQKSLCELRPPITNVSQLCGSCSEAIANQKVRWIITYKTCNIYLIHLKQQKGNAVFILDSPPMGVEATLHVQHCPRVTIVLFLACHSLLWFLFFFYHFSRPVFKFCSIIKDTTMVSVFPQFSFTNCISITGRSSHGMPWSIFVFTCLQVLNNGLCSYFVKIWRKTQTGRKYAIKEHFCFGLRIILNDQAFFFLAFTKALFPRKTLKFNLSLALAETLLEESFTRQTTWLSRAFCGAGALKRQKHWSSFQSWWC